MNPVYEQLTPAQRDCLRRATDLLQEHFNASVIVIRAEPAEGLITTIAEWSGPIDVCANLFQVGHRYIMDTMVGTPRPPN